MIHKEVIALNDGGGERMNISDGVNSTLTSHGCRCQQMVCHEADGDNAPIAFHLTQNPISSEEVSPCVSTGSPDGQAAVGVSVDYSVRRLTPLECERLQGFPDYWTDIGSWTDENGKTHPESIDSARYKAIGNSIALPPWEYVLQKLSICCGEDATMASLFDGIGGFPLIWSRLNSLRNCLWASEIEAFPIAVTKRRFGEEGANNG